jgi:hypothetical protein
MPDGPRGCSPSPGVRPGLCSGPIVKGSLGQEDPRFSSGSRANPMAAGQVLENKKPRARRRGRGWQSFEGSFTSFGHPAPRSALSAHERARPRPSSHSGWSLARR